jgi:phage tail sheath gpL-like
MALTSIGQQKTPGRPVEITFAAETGLPSDAQEVLLIGHAASGATGANTVIVIQNVSDLAAASGEAEAKFGAGSELAKMVIAAVRANAGGSTFPALKAVPLASTETGIPTLAQTAVMATKAEFVVSPYNLNSDSATRTILKNMAVTMSGAQRVDNNQYGTFGVGADQDEDDRSALFKFDTQFLIGVNLYNSSPTYSDGEVAAAAAARMAANGVPFNPLDDADIGSVPAPDSMTEWPTVGAGLQSEAALNQGWTPLFVKPNGSVAFVRTVTGRLTVDGDGVTAVTAYYDVQDFQTLYFWRKTLHARFSQTDFKRVKASATTARNAKAEAIRLATQFEAQNMFQAVQQLAKFFLIERNASDRSRFDMKTPVNVIPGLHVIATNVEAGTQFDVITV